MSFSQSRQFLLSNMQAQSRCFSSVALESPSDPSKKEVRLKFSAFARKEKDYSVDNIEQTRKKLNGLAEQFEPKQEYSRIEFDPNIRHRIDEFPNSLIYRSLVGRVPEKEPQSMYCAV